MSDDRTSRLDGSDDSIEVEWRAPVEERDYQIKTDARLDNYEGDGSVELQPEIGQQEEVVEVPAKPSIANAIYNLLNYIVGAGILGLPYAFRQSGVLLGLILLLFVGLATVYSFYLLLWSSDISKQYSYESLARHGMGNKASTIVKCIIIIDSFGTLSAYLIVVADAARVFFAIFLEEGNVLLDKRVLILLSLVLILPLSLLRKIEALGFTSLLSLLPLGFLLILQIVFLGTLGVGEGVAMFKNSFFLALPIFVFAFSSQQAFFPIYNELKEKSGEHRDMNRVVLISVPITIFSYFTSGLFGVLVFPTTATGNILNSYPHNLAVYILIFSTAVSIILSYPVILYPCRYSVDRLLFPSKEFSYPRFVIETIILILLSIGIATLIPSFATILGLFGSLTNTAVGYILPSLFFLTADTRPIKESKRKWGALALMIIGGGCGLISAVLIIKDYVESFNPQDA